MVIFIFTFLNTIRINLISDKYILHLSLSKLQKRFVILLFISENVSLSIIEYTNWSKTSKISSMLKSNDKPGEPFVMSNKNLYNSSSKVSLLEIKISLKLS